MKTKIITLPLLAIACSLVACTGCQFFDPSTASGSATTIASIFTPQKIASATTDVIGLTTTAVLANNPTYVDEVQSVADAFVALAASNPSVVTTADIQAVLAKTKLSPQRQAFWSAITGGALGVFERNFADNLPTLKPQYNLYVKAVANGLLGALGKPPIS
jgi:hypothetical protein